MILCRDNIFRAGHKNFGYESYYQKLVPVLKCPITGITRVLPGNYELTEAVQGHSIKKVMFDGVKDKEWFKRVEDELYESEVHLFEYANEIGILYGCIKSPAANQVEIVSFKLPKEIKLQLTLL